MQGRLPRTRTCSPQVGQVRQKVGSGRVQVALSGCARLPPRTAGRVGGVLVFQPDRLEHRSDPQLRLTVEGLACTGLPRVSARLPG
jgi:hypothetical protein